MGNHEMDLDEQHAVDYIRGANFSIVAANMHADNFFPGVGERYTSYKVLERGGKKIGIVGYVLNVKVRRAKSRSRRQSSESGATL